MSAQTPLYHTTMESPAGLLTLACTEQCLVFIHFPAKNESLILHWQKAGYAPRHESNELCLQTQQELESYFAGTLQKFTVPVTIQGTSFQTRILHHLQKIPYSKTVTYGELAAAAGYPKASRAAGTVMAKNNIPIILPCHRVLAAGNKLGGYGGGLSLKQYLLDFEKNNEHHQKIGS